SRLRLAHLGVFVESVEERSVNRVVPVEGNINDNQFDLNLSQSGVVRNERYNAVMQETAAQAEELVSKVCKAQAGWMQAAGRVLKSLLLQRAWALWLCRGEEAEAGGFWALQLSLSEQIKYIWKY